MVEPYDHISHCVDNRDVESSLMCKSSNAIQRTDPAKDDDVNPVASPMTADIPKSASTATPVSSMRTFDYTKKSATEFVLMSRMNSLL